MNMQAPSITSILDNVMDNEVEKPQAVPQGTYLTAVIGQPRADKSTIQQRDFLEFRLKLIEPDSDVDIKELAKQGGLKTKDRFVNHTVYYGPIEDKTSFYRLQRFLNDCGVPDGGTLSERVSQAENCYVKVYISHGLSKDGATTYANVTKTMPAD
jgi:hypothetical protein